MTNSIKNIDFFKGGNAIFTVGNNKGEHYTFKIRQPKGDNKPYFVSLLTSTDNVSDYIYMGLYNPNNHNIYLTKKSKFKEESIPVKVLKWSIKTINLNKKIPEGYTIQHEGRCCRCGRMLTTPESIDRGIGPECLKKLM